MGTQSARPQTRVVHWADRNATLVATTLLFFFVSLKVLLVARFDLEAALGILRSSGAVSVALGTLITGAPGLSFVLIFISAAWLVGSSETTPMITRVIAWTLALASFLTMIAVNRLVVLVLMMSLLGWSFFSVGRKAAGTTSQSSVAVAALSGAMLFLVAFFTMKTWLPPEIVVTVHGRLSGYVLEDEGEWLTVLVEPERDVVSLRVRDVIDRQLCETSEEQPTLIEGGPTLMQLFKGSPDSENRPLRCPESAHIDELSAPMVEPGGSVGAPGRSGRFQL